MIEVPWIDLAVQEGTTLTRTVTVYVRDSENNSAIQNLQDCTLTFRAFAPGEDPIILELLAIPSAPSGEGFLVLEPAQYAPLTAGEVYMYDIRLHDTMGEDSVIMQGGFSLIVN